jgi:hypothetical protein
VIEKREVTAAGCLCGHVDYAPIEDEALLSLPGFKVVVIHQDMQEEGYACKSAHLGRTAKALGEKLAAELGDDRSRSTDGDSESDGFIGDQRVVEDDTGLLAG